MARTNWARNYTYRALRLHRPRTIDDLQDLVHATPRLKVLGSRHSFNDIADTPGDHISLDRLPRVVEIDPQGSSVTIDGAMRYGELAPLLHRVGFACHNLASLPHIGVAGACVTATHGSGDRSPSLAAQVTALGMVTGTGELLKIERETDPTIFPGAVVSLGALGVVTQLTLAIEPTYLVRQHVYQDLPFATVEDHFDEITAAADCVSLFTTWTGPTFDQLWVKHRVLPDAPSWEAPPSLFGATRAARALHPIPSMDPVVTTEQLGIPGPWHERIPHFRADHTPSAGAELQTEYLVPRRHGPAALAAIARIRPQVAPLVQTCEVRTIAADDLWLSPAYERDSVGLHFTWLPDWPGVSAILPLLDECLMPYDPRPHWAKLFTLPASQFEETYPRLRDFRRLRERFDPERRFDNPYLARTIG